ncbi:MAG: hypothetical protein A3J83_03940 [Elusimicrobia bacterium RIFOXYA2_FULL_40_6]|nr:MAG: hypothetical protein A3J83_03940 [Elusimicrobia bacterium RIFOXYA2_FULL_40_6]
MYDIPTKYNFRRKIVIIIGERINASRKTIFEAIEKKDVKFIQQEAINQVNAGAHYLDVNCGTNIKDEPRNMEWLVHIIQEVVDVPLVIDSPSPEALDSGLKLCKHKPIVNSITAEKERIKNIAPLVEKYNADVIALTITEEGMPHTAQERLDIAKKIIDSVKQYHIEPERIYFDALVRPISTEPDQSREFLKAIELIKNHTKAKTACGLSNISFGLPNRMLVNSTYLAMAIYTGLDGALIDPTNKQMISILRSAEAIMGQDEYCLNYITAFREGKY